MKKSMSIFARAAVAAAVLTLASGSALAASNLQVIDSHSVSLFTATGGAFGSGTAISPTLWQVKYDSNTFLAFCLDPHVAVNNAANNYSSGIFKASDSVKRLYEGFYSSATSDLTTKSFAAFQVALWELNNDSAHATAGDNANLLAGDLKFKNLSNAVVKEASQMLSVAKGTAEIKNLYNYTSLVSVNPASQTLLSVSPVPEAQTWAMLVAGLGLLGFMARRRKAGQA